MKWKHFKERVLDWLFPGLVNIRETTRELKGINEKLEWFVRSFGICPDCEKKLEECTCDVKYERKVYTTEEGTFASVQKVEPGL